MSSHSIGRWRKHSWQNSLRFDQNQFLHFSKKNLKKTLKHNRNRVERTIVAGAKFKKLIVKHHTPHNLLTMAPIQGDYQEQSN